MSGQSEPSLVILLVTYIRENGLVWVVFEHIVAFTILYIMYYWYEIEEEIIWVRTPRDFREPKPFIKTFVRSGIVAAGHIYTLLFDKHFVTLFFGDWGWLRLMLFIDYIFAPHCTNLFILFLMTLVLFLL